MTAGDKNIIDDFDAIAARLNELEGKPMQSVVPYALGPILSLTAAEKEELVQHLTEELIQQRLVAARSAMWFRPDRKNEKHVLP